MVVIRLFSARITELKILIYGFKVIYLSIYIYISGQIWTIFNAILI